jgi:hypothetical protein
MIPVVLKLQPDHQSATPASTMFQMLIEHPDIVSGISQLAQETD